MWHEESAGSKNEKIQSGRESKMAASDKNSKTNEFSIFSETEWYIWLQFCIIISRTLEFKNIKMKKEFVGELGHSDPFTIYVDPNKIYVGPNV